MTSHTLPAFAGAPIQPPNGGNGWPGFDGMSMPPHHTVAAANGGRAQWAGGQRQQQQGSAIESVAVV